MNKFLANQNKRNETVAVIDIGSNSVRLAIFDQGDGAPFAIYNEKELCGIGRDLDETGKMYEVGIQQALAILPRLYEATLAFGVKETFIIATAAVRDAEGGREFLNKIEAICKQKVMLLSGDWEGRYSAIGLLVSFPDANGIMGDLGGGSVELVGIDQGVINEINSLPLGPLRLKASMREHPHNANKLISDKLSLLPWRSFYEGKNFYCVGGSWRNLARLHMAMKQAPLHIIDHYCINGTDAIAFCEEIAKMDVKQIAKYPDISKKRAELIPYAAYLLHKLLIEMKPAKLYFSAFGIREGVVVANNKEKFNSQDMDKETLPLLLACHKLAGSSWSDPDTIDGDALANWLTPLMLATIWNQEIRQSDGELVSPARLRVLTIAACTLCNFGREEHPDYRAEHAALRILRSALVGLNHEERFFLAATLVFRYGNRPKNYPLLANFEASSLLNLAQLVGLGMRLAFSLSLGKVEILEQYHLEIQKDELQLWVKDQMAQQHNGEMVTKRLSELAKILGLSARIT